MLTKEFYPSVNSNTFKTLDKSQEIKTRLKIKQICELTFILRAR